MGKKYLETKQGSLEQSILGLWEKAAELEEMSATDKAKKTAYQKANPIHKAQNRDSVMRPHRTGEKSAYHKRGGQGSMRRTDSATGVGHDALAKKKDYGKMSSAEKQGRIDALKRKKDELTKEREKLNNSFDAEILELGIKLIEATGAEEKYQAARDKVLKGFGVKSCAALPTEEEKKKCFEALDAAHVADHEESVDYAELHNEINTFKVKNSKESWEDAINQVNEWSKVKKEEDVDENPPKKGKTATGKKPDAIDMNPDVEEGKNK